MKVIIIYATYSGSTELVSANIEEALKVKGYEVTRKHVADTTFDDLQDYDLRIFASPSWDIHGHQGMPHEKFVTFIESAKGKTLQGKKFAVIGLGDTNYPIFTGAVDHLEEFVKELQGELIVKSHRIDGYYFDQHNADDGVIAWINEIDHVLNHQS
jgi:flavodoxin